MLDYIECMTIRDRLLELLRKGGNDVPLLEGGKPEPAPVRMGTLAAPVKRIIEQPKEPSYVPPELEGDNYFLLLTAELKKSANPLANSFNYNGKPVPSDWENGIAEQMYRTMQTLDHNFPDIQIVEDTVKTIESTVELSGGTESAMIFRRIMLKSSHELRARLMDKKKHMGEMRSLDDLYSKTKSPYEGGGEQK